jgi:hypothetical protein
MVGGTVMAGKSLKRFTAFSLSEVFLPRAKGDSY